MKVLFRTVITACLVAATILYAQPASERAVLQQLLARPDDTSKVQALLQHARQMEDPGEIRKTIQLAGKLATRIGDARGEAQAWALTGELYMEVAEVDSARMYLRKALVPARRTGAAGIMLQIAQSLGALAAETGKLDSAVVILMEAIHQQEALGNASKTGGLWLSLTECYLKLRLYDRAIEATHRIEHIARSIADQRNIGAAFTYRAMAYGYLGKNDDAKQLLNQAIALAQSTPDPVDELPPLSAYADFLNDTRQYARAIRAYEEFLRHPRFPPPGQRMASVLTKLAHAQMYSGLFDKAKATLERAGQMATEAHAPVTQLDIAHSWMRWQLLQTPGGVAKLDEYLALNDSLFSDEKAQIALDLQTRYETAKKDQQLAEQRVLLLEAERRKWLLLGAVGVLILLGGLAVWLYRTNRFKEQTNRRLAALNAELGTLNGVKDRLLSIIAHDLRSPLSALSASVQLFRRGRADAARMTAFADEMQQALSNTVAMMDTLLQWSKTQMQGIVPRPAPLSVASLAAEVRDMADIAASAKQIAIDCGDIDEAETVFADPNMLRVALFNVVSNAVKFTRPGGLVVIRTEPAPDASANLRLIVQDSGVGMTATQLAAIGHAIESTRGTADERGTGLGLVLVQRFMAALHGSMALASTPGEGTVVTLTLPTEPVIS